MYVVLTKFRYFSNYQHSWRRDLVRLGQQGKLPEATTDHTLVGGCAVLDDGDRRVGPAPMPDQFFHQVRESPDGHVNGERLPIARK